LEIKLAKLRKDLFLLYEDGQNALVELFLKYIEVRLDVYEFCYSAIFIDLEPWCWVDLN